MFTEAIFNSYVTILFSSLGYRNALLHCYVTVLKKFYNLVIYLLLPEFQKIN